MDTPKTEYLLEIAGELAMKYGCEAIGSEHILMAMIKDGDNEAFRFWKIIRFHPKESIQIF